MKIHRESQRESGVESASRDAAQCRPTESTGRRRHFASSNIENGAEAGVTSRCVAACRCWAAGRRMKQDVEGSARNRPGTGSREPSVGSSAGAVLAALGVGLCPACFGFTMGFTGTALDALTKPPSEGGALTASEAASFTAAATLSAAVGSLLGGPMADRWGRKRGLVVAMAVCGVGFVLIALGREYHALLAGRLLGGLAIGAVSVATPLYLAEISPPRLRGALGSTMQLAIVSGLLLVYVVGYEVVPTRGWRCLAAIGALIPTVRLTALSPLSLISSYKPESPCAEQCFVLLVAPLLPESPRWLAASEYPDRVEGSLLVLRGTCAPTGERQALDAAILDEGAEMIRDSKLRQPGQTTSQNPGGMGAVLCTLFASGEDGRALRNACAVMSFQQLSGINAVNSASPSTLPLRK